MTQTSFTLAYFISLTITLISIYCLEILAPNMLNIIKFFLIPITIALVTLFLLNKLIPVVDETGDNISDYIEYKLSRGIDNTVYYQLFPPLVIVLIISFVLIYLGVFN